MKKNLTGKSGTGKALLSLLCMALALGFGVSCGDNPDDGGDFPQIEKPDETTDNSENSDGETDEDDSQSDEDDESLSEDEKNPLDEIDEGALARLEITKVYAAASPAKSNYEYVEFHALSDGNLFGLELFSANDGEAKSFKFPDVSVKKDEMIVVHLRKGTGEGFESETGDDLNLSTAKFSSAARDLWHNGSGAALGDSDALLLRKRKSGGLVDAVFYVCNDASKWTDEMTAAAQDALDAGLWKGTASSDAIQIGAKTFSDAKTLVKTQSGIGKDCWEYKGIADEKIGVLPSDENDNDDAQTGGNAQTGEGDSQSGGNAQAGEGGSQTAKLEMTKVFSGIRTSDKTHEYVEFHALKDANLLGLKLYSAGKGETAIYEFPSVNVKKGDMIVVHLQNIGDGCANELDNDLNASTANWSSDARDLWGDNTSTALDDFSDVILLRDTSDGNAKLVDAVLYVGRDIENWQNDYVKGKAYEADEANLWNGSAVSDAVKITYKKMGETNSLVKTKRGIGKDCWEYFKVLPDKLGVLPYSE